MNRFTQARLAALCATALLSTAAAQNAPSTPAQVAQNAVKIRKALLDVQQFAFGPVIRMLRGSTPFDAAAAAKSGARIRVTASMIPEVFQSDTHEFAVQTKAREGIWSNKADFDAKAKDLQDAAAALETAAKGGDRDATLTAAKAVGKACSACHDEYKDN